MGTPRTIEPARFQVPWEHRFFGALVERHGRLWRAAGDAESRLMRRRIEGTAIDRPVYVAGLARSGSTVLLELLARRPGVATHQYRDFPFLHCPVAWNKYLGLVPRRRSAPVERAHLDGILITPESPEAMEEMLWMDFFPGLHDPGVSNVLDTRTQNLDFEAFYRDHIRKVLMVRRGTRYVAKGNYNLTRLRYLHALFPDARFVIPVRHPVMHAASLLKQHRLFLKVERAVPDVADYMRRVGHFEFGTNRVPVNAGDGEVTRSIMELWRSGEEARGLGRYWASLYGYARGAMDANRSFEEACLVVRFEDLCLDSAGTIRRILVHCGMEASEEDIGAEACRIAAPKYYRPDFTPEERSAILEESASCRELYGYGEEDPTAGEVTSQSCGGNEPQ